MSRWIVILLAPIAIVGLYFYMGVYLAIWYIYWWLGWTKENPNIWRRK